MPSTYSPLKIELIATGEQSGTWGTTTNTNLGTALEEAIVGSANVAFSSADVTLTLTDTNAAQTARNLRLNLTGTSGGARNLILGSGCQIEKPYLINNGLADTVTVKNTTGNGIAVPAGKTMWVYNNGTDVVDAVNHLTSVTLGTALAVPSGGLGITTVTQGDILYASGANTITVLAKNTSATRYLANTGTSNNPAWAQIDLSNGVTGDLPFANLAQIAGLSVLGVTGSSTADVAAITAASDHQVFRRSGSAVAFGAVALNQANAVTGTLAAGNGGTGSAFFTVSGPASSIKTYTFPNENMTVVGTTQTQTLTNKTITQRVSSTASISSPLAFNSDNFDLYAATAQAGDLTINADAGTPTDGQKIIFRFTCDGTARTITFTGGASKAFKPVGANLTVAGSNFTYALTINKTTYFGCVYNTSSSRWEVVALSQEA
jgi:hypothetical protein